MPLRRILLSPLLPTSCTASVPRIVLATGVDVNESGSAMFPAPAKWITRRVSPESSLDSCDTIRFCRSLPMVCVTTPSSIRAGRASRSWPAMASVGPMGVDHDSHSRQPPKSFTLVKTTTLKPSEKDNGSRSSSTYRASSERSRRPSCVFVLAPGSTR